MTSSGDGYATLIVRVPERLFDTAIRRFSKLGEVQSVSTSSEDVTSQYVDLQARLRHYRAVERRLVGFLAGTTTVNQMLAVQDRIDQVQLTIEELTAQLKSLRETTTYGTLSVFLCEKDRTPSWPPATPSAAPSGTRCGCSATAPASRPSRCWPCCPFIVVFGGVGVVVWFVVRARPARRRQAAQPSLPA